MRVRLPLRRFTTACNDNAGAVLGLSSFYLDSRGEMHQRSNRADHTLRMVNQPHELPQFGSAAEIEHPIEARVNVLSFSYLDKKDSAAKVVYYLLPSCRVPPLDRVIRLPPGYDDPKRQVDSSNLLDLGHPEFLLGSKVNITFESRGFYVHAQLFAKIIDESVNEVDRTIVAMMDQWIIAVDVSRVLIVVGEPRQMRIVRPKSPARCANVDCEASGVREVQIANRRREHDNIPRRLEVFQDDLAHVTTIHVSTRETNYFGKLRLELEVLDVELLPSYAASNSIHADASSGTELVEKPDRELKPVASAEIGSASVEVMGGVVCVRLN